MYTQLPYIVHGKNVVADSTLIVKYLLRTYPGESCFMVLSVITDTVLHLPLCSWQPTKPHTFRTTSFMLPSKPAAMVVLCMPVQEWTGA